MSSVALVIEEAEILSRYLIGKVCAPAVAFDYERAVNAHGAVLSKTEEKAWQWMMRSSIMLRCMDAGLALQAPKSNIRKRIFIMLCILETEQGFNHHFIPVQRPIGHIFLICLRGVRAVMAAVLGMLIIRIYRLHID